MKILFLIKALSYPGGAERVLTQVAEALAERGHDVVIADFGPPQCAPFYPLSKALRRVALNIGDPGSPSRVNEIARRLVVTRQLALREAPDVAIGVMHSSYVLLAAALSGIGIPAIGSEHTVYEYYLPRPLQRILLLLAARYLRAVTVVSKTARFTFPESLRRKMQVIPNPLWQSAVSADVVGDAAKTLLSVGRLEPEKDQGTLISAFGMLADRFPQWNLRILGEGALRGRLEQQVRSLGLATRAELPGVVHEISKEYARAQLFVLPSAFESFGLATAEAMAHGLPVVGFAECPGTKELIVDGVNGILAGGVSNPETLAGAMSRLMSSPALRKQFGSAARQSVAQFDIVAVVDGWERLVHEAVAGPAHYPTGYSA